MTETRKMFLFLKLWWSRMDWTWTGILIRFFDHFQKSQEYSFHFKAFRLWWPRSLMQCARIYKKKLLSVRLIFFLFLKKRVPLLFDSFASEHIFLDKWQRKVSIASSQFKMLGVFSKVKFQIGYWLKMEIHWTWKW